MKNLLFVGIAGLLACGLALTAFAQTNSARDEINTARAHAMMAQHADTLAMAHTHLHHVINCLVGRDGQGFDAKAGMPCKGMGHGALPDSKGNHALHAKLEDALADAQAGLKSDSLDTVHKDAAKAAAALKDAGTPAQKASSGYSW
ncbi:MAG: hypothetical protein L0I62_06275 [Gammaproteobacteria bacterium]|nr:hypothetical protein [Gammaproteobacteria bacterium]